MTTRRSSVVVVLCFLTMLGSIQSAFAQSSRIDNGAVSQAKFGFYWETRLEPGSPPLPDSFSTGTADAPGIVYRVMLDLSRKTYVGYTALVSPLAEPNTYSVTFQKLAMTPELAKRFLGDSPSGWTQVQTPGWGLSPQIIRSGDVLSMNLLVNNATNQRVVDYVTVQEPTRRFRGWDSVPDRQFSFSPGPARDFRADDVELSIRSPRLSINGKLDETSMGRFDSVSGSVVWIYASKRGRFLLSLVPHPELGFRKAGEVRGSSLSFTVGGDMFTLNTDGRIAPGQAALNLYILHDPEWKPTYANADLVSFKMGAADRAESLIRK
jgi:hypothetical protein